MVSGQQQTAAAPVLVPAPRVLRPRTTLSASVGPAGIRLETPDGEAWRWVREALGGAVREGWRAALVYDATRDGHPEGYTLDTCPDGFVLTARDAPGAWYGVMTLRQLLRTHRNGTLPALHIEDWPEFPLRGYLLDISRDKVPTLDTLKALVARLSEWKYNQLQLYMEHTFAYRAYPEVWLGASPLTKPEVRELDAWCRRHFIELVPCQNSLAHMERWLRHERLRPLAELPEDPTCLCPTDPEARAFMGSLYDELLPSFQSRRFNVCCDEAWQVGRGRSAAEVARHGVGPVYLDYLLEMRRRARKHVDEVWFWGDMLVPFHVEVNEETGLYRPLPRTPSPLLDRLPEDMTALVWGYRPDDPLDAMAAEYAGAGVPFLVCPGTSNWCSPLGRHDRMLANVRGAVAAACSHDAWGMLLCDWNWLGWSCLDAAWPAAACGAGAAWAPDANRDLDLPAILDAHVFPDRLPGSGEALCEAANVYQLPDRREGRDRVNLPLFMLPLLLDPGACLAAWTRHVSPAGLEEALDRLPRLERNLPTEDTRTAACLVAILLRLMRGLAGAEQAALRDLPSALRHEVADQLEALLPRYRDNWHRSNRPGGLVASTAPMERLAAHCREPV